MSEDGEKAAVFRTTKVRTKLKGDSSWLQQRSDSQTENTDGKVRTKLKGDNVWLQRQQDESQAAAAAEEKPWMAELRNCRQNGEAAQTSPAPSPTKPAPTLSKAEAERAPSSGFIIRGIFTKLDSAASSTATNTVSGSTQAIKKPSESYRKIAPHTVKSPLENQEPQLSEEEQQKRREAASSVLKQSAARQRSYVLSAAKKFESQQDASDPTLDKINQSFVATRVEIIEDESAGAAAPIASAPQPKPRRTSGASVGEEPAAPKNEGKEEAPPLVPVPLKDPFEDVKPGCTKVDTPLPELSLECVQSAETEASALPGQNDEALVQLVPEVAPPTPAPPAEASAAPVPAPTAVVPGSPPPASVVPEPAPSSPVPEPTTPEPTAPTAIVPEFLAPVAATPESPTPASPVPEPTAVVSPQSPAPASAAPESPVPSSPLPESPAPVPLTPESLAPTILIPESLVLVSAAPESPVATSPVPESQASPSLFPVPASAATEITEKTEQEAPLDPSSGGGALAALSDTLVSFDASSSSFRDDGPTPAEREASPAEERAGDERAEETPTPELSNCVPVTEDLLAFTSGPDEPSQPVPPSPGRWSQDLLSELSSESVQTSGPLDLLVDDITFISREAPGLNVEPEEEKQEVDGTRSPVETVTITTETVIITDNGGRVDPEAWSSDVKTTVVESSLADPFDPYPIGTAAPKSSADLLQPDSDISINSVSTTYTENGDRGTSVSGTRLEKTLEDDVTPVDTDITRLSTRRSWACTWETGPAEQSQEAAAEDGDQKMFVMFERKSSENDSPWDRWTSPTVYTTTTAEEEEEVEEEEEEEERPEDTQTETVTTVTTIREIQGEPEPAMDHYGTYSRTLIEEDQRVQTASPEAKKPFVYVKEYINTTASSLHGLSGSEYSSSNTYSSGSGSSACTYCGEPVGSGSKITIEHLNVNSHPHCFKCAVCGKPMGDLLDSMFIHSGKVNCESCYSRAFD